MPCSARGACANERKKRIGPSTIVGTQPLTLFPEPEISAETTDNDLPDFGKSTSSTSVTQLGRIIAGMKNEIYGRKKIIGNAI